jgi:cathepsin L
MRFITLAILAVTIYCASSASIFDSSLDNVWLSFKAEHSKTYASVEEESSRRLIFENNHKLVQRHNLEASRGKHTYTLKMNKFGDFTNQEFRKMMNGFNMTAHRLAASQKPEVFGHNFENPTVEIPDSVDWRTQGYVTPIKDQGQCGSCWAFSAVAGLEGQHFKASGKLVSLSEQNLVDCSGKFGNQGCDGGLMDQAFQYIKANKGIDTEASYPYEAVDGKCRFNKQTVGATDTGFVDVKSGDESALAQAIASIGPISVAIDASQDSFQFYSSGIYSDPGCSSTELDHGVTAVGYGTQGKGKDFYIVKNSWGTSWGDQGYILMARNKKNMCGIATSASYPTV